MFYHSSSLFSNSGSQNKYQDYDIFNFFLLLSILYANTFEFKSVDLTHLARYFR